MPKPATSSGSGVIAVRSSKFFQTPPGPLGFNKLVDPEDPFNDGKLRFKVSHHYTDPQAERLMSLIDRDVIAANWDAFVKECERSNKAAPTGGWKVPSGRDWVNDHLKAAKEGARQQLPHIDWANEAEFKDRNGALKRKTMRVYDSAGDLLDIQELVTGSAFFDIQPGSIVQTIVQGGLFISGLVKHPQPSFKLQGIRIIKLEEGNKGSSLGEVSDEDMALAGVDEADDMSAYMGSSLTKNQQAAPAGKHPTDLDDDLPF